MAVHSTFVVVSSDRHLLSSSVESHKAQSWVIYCLLHCALASCGAVYCNRSCLWVCESGRAVSEPYYSQRPRSVCVSLSAFFIMYIADLVALIDKHGFCPHLYADDTQIYGSTRHSAVNDLQRRLSACIDDVYSTECSLTASS